ncbi:hypothetical protein GCM10023220_35830 [Streptomyces ziwulingensis]|uniref:Uncharacterized protein n=1 Tax=Streptomyces ziwulingensis TaxID=1045501 RepID=A0ABP9C1E7_9ACTN
MIPKALASRRDHVDQREPAGVELSVWGTVWGTARSAGTFVPPAMRMPLTVRQDGPPTVIALAQAPSSHMWPYFFRPPAHRPAAARCG